MGISYNVTERVFHLDTPHSSYMIGIVDEEGLLGHVYYGRRVADDNMQYLMRIFESPYVPTRNNRDRVSIFDALPVEYPGHGVGDFRESCLRLETEEGYNACALVYDSHRIYKGKSALPGLPATFGGEDQCQTLELVAKDPVLGLTVRLFYSVFEGIDAVCRSARIENTTGKALHLTAVLSACLDLDNRDFDRISLHGNWSAERMINRTKLGMGREGARSLRGITSAQEQPFLALAEHTATQEQGEVYAMNLIYSGNFLAQAELGQFGQVRMVMGINPTDFCWNLAPGESFQTPEAVLVYSDRGLGAMTRTFHDLYRQHLIRGQEKYRPSLVNNWEATYFNFNTEKLIDIARDAAAAGIEMLVVDDGWFGHRNDDNSSLGDWFVNEEKLPGGLGHLVEEVNKLGLKFGIWMEPEMISVDSELYRVHPDYALQIPGRPGTLGRNQLVLDLSRQDVRDCIYGQIHKILSSANIEYVKWDMNRQLTDVASFQLKGRSQGELYHRYVLGLYELQERMLRDFPHILLENCASGGARFDAGMLYYGPQIWTSDNTDAIDRLKIQEGTAMIYPLSAMGAHVAACPSHTNGRTTPFATRADVALPGCFGYELDLTQLSREEKDMIPGQLENYRKYKELFHRGDYYRLASYSQNGEYDLIMAVSKDKRRAVMVFVQVMTRYRGKSIHQRLAGLEENRLYRCSLDGSVHTGGALMYGGLLLPKTKGDYVSRIIELEAVEP